MSELHIFLTTRGRPHEQLTLAAMPVKWIQRTTVVCPREDRDAISREHHAIADFAHPPVKNLAQKRQWIFNYCHKNKIDRILMLDDDLKFRVRLNPSSNKVETPEPIDTRLDRMFTQLERMLGHYAHGGIAMQYMQQANKTEWKYGGRYLHLLGYHVPTVMEHCKLGRILLSSDYDYALQLFAAGYTSAVYCRATEDDPRGFNAPGGVSLYRNVDRIRECSEQLAKLHPGIVSLRPYKAGSKYEHLGVRTQAAWKKALKMGLETRAVAHGTLTGKKVLL